MKLKPIIPFFELLIFPIMIFFSIKILLLSFSKSQPLIMLGSLVFFVSGILSIFLINRSFKILVISDKLNIKGYFWGQKEIELKDIKGYKLKEIRGGKFLIHDVNIILINWSGKEISRFTRGDYKESDLQNFMNRLSEHKIEYINE